MEPEIRRQMQKECDRLSAKSAALSGESAALRQIGCPDTTHLDEMERRILKRLSRLQRRLKIDIPETNFPLFYVYDMIISDLLKHLPKEYRDCRVAVRLIKENEKEETGISLEKSGKEILCIKMTDYETKIEKQEDVGSVLKSLYADCRKELLKQKKIRNQAER